MNQIIIDDKKDVPKNFVVRKSKDINNEEQKRIFSAIDSYYMPNIKINEQQRKI